MMKRKVGKNRKTEIVLTVSLLATFLICLQVVFSLVEKLGGLVAGTDSVTVSVVVTPSISIDSPADVTLSPSIEETGTANGSVTWNIETNNSDGWRLDLSASTTPAMQNGGDSFADYTEATPGTPESWSVAAADSEFGFNAAGTYAEGGFAGSKFLGFDGGSSIQAAHRDAPSDGAGDDAVINFRAEVGASHNQPTGTYSATITASATTL